MSPRISIIIPVYNTEKYLAKCLESLVGQTIKDVQIICINDGSTDNSGNMLDLWAKKDNRILVSHQENGGAAAARNDGLKIATGEYVGFCDPDDYVSLDYYENLYTVATNNNADVAKGLGKIIWQNGKVGVFGPDLDSINRNRANFNYSFTTAIYRREFLDRNKIDFPQKLIVGEDSAFVIQAACLANKIALAKNNSYYFYIRRDNSLDSDILNDKKIESNIETANTIIDFINKVDVSASVYYSVFSQWVSFSINMSARTESAKMRELIAKSLIKLWDKCKFKYAYEIKNPDLAKLFEKHEYVELLSVLAVKKGKFCRLRRIPIFIKRKREMSGSIKLFFYDDEFNFGDLLGVDISRKLFNVNIVKSNEKNCVALFIGSLLQCFLSKKHFSKRIKYLLRPRVKIWGAGFIEPQDDKKEKLMRRIEVRAVRGKLSLARLQKITGKKLKNAAIGDPGLLASKLIDISKIEKKYTLGIIPHYVDKGSELLNKIRVKNSIVIDIQQSPKTFLGQLAECENVISSAMHGLIAADSLGIPNVRMIVSDKIVGGDYKYNDYYSAFGLDSHPTINVNKYEFSDTDLKNLYAMDAGKIKEICVNLMRSFPYKYKEDK